MKAIKIILSIFAVLVVMCASFAFYLYKTDREITWDSWRILLDSHYDRQNLFGEPVYVYETEVDDGTACTAIEQYDPQRHVCAYQCNTKSECEAKQKEVDDELASWTESKNEGKPIKEKAINNDNSTLKAEYQVKNGKLILLRGTDEKEFQDLWSKIVSLAPAYILEKYLKKFQVYSDKNDETIAFAETEDDDIHWRFGINYPIYALDDEKEKKVTLIHELSHIITLNDTQIVQDERCPTYKSDDGCAVETSYLNKFVNEFWHVKSEPADGNNENADGTKFVDPYAATNPEEDIAETFAYFVLNPKATGSEIKDQKLNFFYQFQELVQMRKEIRDTLAREILN